MVNNPLDYDTLYNELLKHYLGIEHYPITLSSEAYNTSEVTATTLDEYLMYLSKGYINITLDSEYDRYLMELLEDDWFFRWPLVRWTYASRILNGKGYRKSTKRALKLLEPLVKEGCPGAIFDIGFCYRYNEGLKFNYERAICFWIEASKRGYSIAQEYLYNEYEINEYKKLGDELKLYFLYEVFIHYPKIKGATWDNYAEKLADKETAQLKKIFNEGKKLEKVVSQKALFRSFTHLFWSKEEDPYKIDF